MREEITWDYHDRIWASWSLSADWYRQTLVL